jgi:hypothetical protein
MKWTVTLHADKTNDLPDITIERVIQAYVTGRCKDCGRSGNGRHRPGCQAGAGQSSFVEGVALGIRYAMRFANVDQKVKDKVGRIDGRQWERELRNAVELHSLRKLAADPVIAIGHGE